MDVSGALEYSGEVDLHASDVGKGDGEGVVAVRFCMEKVGNGFCHVDVVGVYVVVSIELEGMFDVRPSGVSCCVELLDVCGVIVAVAAVDSDWVLLATTHSIEAAVIVAAHEEARNTADAVTRIAQVSVRFGVRFTVDVWCVLTF